MSEVSLVVNGRKVGGAVEDRTLLVHYLRENLGLTGTHVGCDTSQCGACVVHVDGKAVKSCTILAVAGFGVDGRDHRRAGQRRRPAPGAGSVPRAPRPAMRVLHARHDHGGNRHDQAPSRRPRRSDREGRARGQYLPLHRLPQYRQGDPRGVASDGQVVEGKGQEGRRSAAGEGGASRAKRGKATDRRADGALSRPARSAVRP